MARLSGLVVYPEGQHRGLVRPNPETPDDRAIREEGERIRKAFPSIDFDHPGARKTRAEPG
jgi:hypothetical protein